MQLRSDRAGFLAFVVMSLIAIGFAVWMLLSGGNTTTTTEASDVVQTLAQPAATEAPVAPTAVPFEPQPTAEFVPAPPTPTPEPTATPAPTPEPASSSSSSSSSGTTTTTSAASDAGSTSSSGGTTTTTVAAAATAGQPDPAAAPQAAPASGSASRVVSAAAAFTYVAQPRGNITIYDGPDGNPKQLTYQFLDGRVVENSLVNPTTGNAYALRVIQGSPGDGWLKVMLPTRPNGQTGWVKEADVRVSSSDYYIQINISNNTVAAWKGDQLIMNTAAATGTAQTPTPRVSAFVDEKMILGGAYGDGLLSLGVFSNAHNTFGGGIPKIALHGNNNPAVLGSYASNGCIRIGNAEIVQLYNTVPLGTRVEIVG